MKLVLIAIVALALASSASASPCADKIAKLQARFDASAPAAANPIGGATAPESDAAKLHHQPTAATAGDASGSPDSETTLKRARFQNDLFNAQAAEHSGDVKGCEAAVAAAEKDLAP